MSHKDRPFRLSGAFLIRFLLFIVILFLLFSYLGQRFNQGQKSTLPSVLGVETLKPYTDWAVNQLPPQSRTTLQNLPQSPVIIQLQSKIKDIQTKYLDGFPDKQIKEIQKAIVKDVSDRLIQNIDKK